MNIGLALNPFATTSTDTSSTDTSLTNQQKMAKLGLFWDKANGIYAKGKELGLFDNLLNKLGLGGGDQQPVVPIDQSGYTPIVVEPPKPGMSTTTKVLIGFGVAAVLITIIVLATRNKGTETAVKTK
jgi:hypothetical protein